MGYSVAGKKALVTGGSSGIGAAVAVALSKAGANVGICARRENLLREVLEECRAAGASDARMWIADLGDLDAVDDFAARADEELGGIDLLVNNAGIPKRRFLLDLTPDVVESVMAINYFSPIRLTLALLPRMIERGEGRIVNISSVAARLSPPHEAAYAASKAALSAWSECMAVDLADTPIKVHVVNPGVIDTELFTLPDNDPLLAPVEALPVSAVTTAVLAQLEAGTFEIWVPEWFGDIAAGKATNLEGYLEGSAGWLAEQRRQQAAPS